MKVGTCLQITILHVRQKMKLVTVKVKEGQAQM